MLNRTHRISYRILRARNNSTILQSSFVGEQSLGGGDSKPTYDPYFSRALEGYPVEVRQSPSFGRGLFATRKISTGETVLREKPFVSADPNYADEMLVKMLKLNEPTNAKRSRTLVALMAHWILNAQRSEQWPCDILSASPSHLLMATNNDDLQHDIKILLQRNLFETLTKLFDLDGHKNWDEFAFGELFRTIKTNVYGLHVYIAHSMINHSCFYNTIWDPNPPYSPTEPSAETRIAICDIEEGEEIFCEYSDQPDVLKLYGIECQRHPEIPKLGLKCVCAKGRHEHARKFVFIHETELKRKTAVEAGLLSNTGEV